MILLIRVILIGLIFYLIIKPFVKFFEDQGDNSHNPPDDHKPPQKNKGVSKELGEYVDYEEVD